MKMDTKQIVVTLLMLVASILIILFVKPHYALLGYRVSLSDILITFLLLMDVLYCGLLSGILLAVVLPVLAFVLTASSLIASTPMLLPCLMIGNLILVLVAWLVRGKRFELNVLPVALIAGAVAKYAAVLLLIVYWVGKKNAYSISQLLETLAGVVLVCMIWPLVKLAVKK